MKIEIWSDVVCPWCYIGKRNLEVALAGFEHRRPGGDRVAELRARPRDPPGWSCRWTRCCAEVRHDPRGGDGGQPPHDRAGRHRGSRVPPRQGADRQYLRRPPPHPPRGPGGTWRQHEGAAAPPRTSPRGGPSPTRRRWRNSPTRSASTRAGWPKSSRARIRATTSGPTRLAPWSSARPASPSSYSTNGSACPGPSLLTYSCGCSSTPGTPRSRPWPAAPDGLPDDWGHRTSTAAY